MSNPAPKKNIYAQLRIMIKPPLKEDGFRCTMVATKFAYFRGATRHNSQPIIMREVKFKRNPKHDNNGYLAIEIDPVILFEVKTGIDKVQYNPNNRQGFVVFELYQKDTKGNFKKVRDVYGNWFYEGESPTVLTWGVTQGVNGQSAETKKEQNINILENAKYEYQKETKDGIHIKFKAVLMPHTNDHVNAITILSDMISGVANYYLSYSVFDDFVFISATWKPPVAKNNAWKTKPIVGVKLLKKNIDVASEYLKIENGAVIIPSNVSNVGSCKIPLPTADAANIKVIISMTYQIKFDAGWMSPVTSPAIYEFYINTEKI